METSTTIAIVGIGGVFPQSHNLKEFWERIRHGQDATTDTPPHRWSAPQKAVYEPGPARSDKVYTNRGCFVNDQDLHVNYASLKVSASLVEHLDPMFKIGLVAAQQAFSDAKMGQVNLERVGLIIGNIVLPTDTTSALTRELLGSLFEEQQFGSTTSDPNSQINPLNRYAAGLPGGLIAKALGLGASSYTLDAACASSLYALKLAADELIAGRVDAMLTGGLSRPDCLYTQMGFSQLNALSPTGKASPFDQNGNGLVVGEGAGMFMLKRLTDALASGDHIYATIQGVGLSNDVDGSLLAPSNEGQLRAMRAAYRQAGWSPLDIDLIECHATGTPLGDAVEFESLCQLWADCSPPKTSDCVIGSVKSNVGHLLTAAGASSLIKALLAMQEKVLPPTANFEKSAVDLSSSPFRILTEAEPWEDKRRPRRAAISAFGFGGINAHFLIEEWAPEYADSLFTSDIRREEKPIAIVGLDAYFGAWPDKNSFMSRVLGEELTTEPETCARWWGAEQSSWFKERFPVNAKGFYLNELKVPLGKFRIPPKELEEMLPQQLLMLLVAVRAFEDAGLDATSALQTGVFIGIGLDLNATNFQLRWGLEQRIRQWFGARDIDIDDAESKEKAQEWRELLGPALNANRTVGSLGGMVASRIARELRFGGSSFTVSSEETSGLHALEIAVRAIQSGALSRALVGAVDLAGDLRSVISTHSHAPLSESGKSAPFDSSTEGWFPGEGAAAVVLKPLEDALRDGDRIYAVVKNVATTTQQSEKETLASAYERSLRSALARIELDPKRVGYIEAHGSGVPKEDEAELEALLACFGENLPVLGSVKADIGFSGAASGLASLVKAGLALYHERITSLRHFETCLEMVVDRVSFRKIYECFPNENRLWLRNRLDGVRVAAVAGISVGGSCALALLEGVEQNQPKPPVSSDQPALLFVEGDHLPELVEALLQLRERRQLNLHAMARLCISQPQKKYGLAMLIHNLNQFDTNFAIILKAFQNFPDDPFSSESFRNLINQDAAFFTMNPLGTKGKLAFVFPGSGSHFKDMGRELALRWPSVFRKQDHLTQHFADQIQPGLFWSSYPTKEIEDDAPVLLSSQVALGTALGELLNEMGIKPRGSIGYSLGESVAMFALKAWQDRDGLFLRTKESTLFRSDLAGPCLAARQVWGLEQNESVRWVVGVVNRSEADVNEIITETSRVYLLIVNTPKECVIGGAEEEVNQVVKALGSRFYPLSGVVTVHCELLQPVAQAYRAHHLLPTRAPKGIRFYSGAWARSFDLTRESIANAILAQALEGVHFPKTIRAAYKDGFRIFIEVGPGGSCTRMIRSILKDSAHLALALCPPVNKPLDRVVALVAELLTQRVPVNPESLWLPDHQQHVWQGASLTIPVRAKVFGPEPKTVGEREKALPESQPAPEGLSQPIPITPLQSPGPQQARYAEKPVASHKFFTVKPDRVAHSKAQKTKGSALIDALNSAHFADALTPAEFAESLSATAKAHEKYLDFALHTQKTMAQTLEFQTNLYQELSSVSFVPAVQAPEDPLRQKAPFQVVQARSKPPELESRKAKAGSGALFMDRQTCLEFAIGSIGKVLGPAYAEVDSYPSRVRLPDEPLMLVDRILEVGGTRMRDGYVVTEHDVQQQSWYLDANRIPTCIAVEAGQADLFLSSYLGIDFETKGEAVYRLLDAVVTFHDDLPSPGHTIRYDIKIEKFFKQGGSHFFRFKFVGTVNGKPLLTMRDGCAGFFGKEALAAGKGIVQTEIQKRTEEGKRPKQRYIFHELERESYSDEQIEALRHGDLAACFGEPFHDLPLEDPVKLPSGRMNLVHRVLDLVPTGGRFGLGWIRAEADVRSDDWFLTSHFIDDRVMPGTLMYECCLHSLRVLLYRMGWVAEANDVLFQPVPGVESRLKCRGQVLETTQKAAYEVTLKEIGYRPEPYVIVDALMYSDGKCIVEITDMSLSFKGLTYEKLESIWQGRPPNQQANAQSRTYNAEQIRAYATGNPSEGFGDRYKIFDHDRVLARLPGPPFLFVDRVIEIQNAEPWRMVAGGSVVAEYDVPNDAWYFQSNRQSAMPFVVLLEIALQPCGWFAAYMGSALTSETDLSFRNLGGKATQLRAVTAKSGILAMEIKATNISSSGGMIIQNYNFSVRDAQGPIYVGTTYFGFFSKQALANQVGLRDVQGFQPSEAEKATAESFAFPRETPFPDQKLSMIDQITCFLKDGGPQGLGYICGTKHVVESEWFFKAHFYQDPVVPGSLGLESFLQLLKIAAAMRWGTANTRFQAVALNEEHEWVYRGQVVPSDALIEVQAVIIKVDNPTKTLWADGYLSVDGRVIYQMKRFSLSMVAVSPEI